MSFDYNLVIIGGSLTARYAAAKASQLGARVALVEPDRLPFALGPLQHQFALHLRQLVEQVDKTHFYGLAQPKNDADQTWQDLLNWMDITKTIVANETIVDSLAHLAATGVDVIVGEGSFVPEFTVRGKRQQRPAASAASIHHRHSPSFLVNGRYLRSRRYLLALAAPAIHASFGGLSPTNCRTIETLWQSPWPTLPSRLLILGNDPRGIELAQLFNRLGCQVTLIVRQQRLLPGEDPESIAWLQAHLEAEGIAVLTQTSITQSKQLGKQVWVQAGDRALEADALLLASPQRLDLSHLNLEAIGVEWKPSGILVNQKLQTTHDRIYACGDALGGYVLPHVAEDEAMVALKNALFGKRARVDYRSMPWSLFTSPSLVRVGLTEPQAKRHYNESGDDIVVLRQSLQLMSQAQIQQESTGFGKLIVRRNGQIVGAHLLGANAAEWISTIALAMKHHIPLHAIDRSLVGSGTLSELLAQFVEQWQEQRRPKWQQEFWETWFAWQR